MGKTINGRTVFAGLRNALATLYPDIASARIVVDDTGLDARRINFDSQAIKNWHAILSEAHKTHKIDDLIDVIPEEYRKNQELCDAVDTYRNFINQGGRVDPSLPIANILKIVVGTVVLIVLLRVGWPYLAGKNFCVRVSLNGQLTNADSVSLLIGNGIQGKGEGDGKFCFEDVPRSIETVKVQVRFNHLDTSCVQEVPVVGGLPEVKCSATTQTPTPVPTPTQVPTPVSTPTQAPTPIPTSLTPTDGSTPTSTPIPSSTPYFNIYTDAAASDNHFNPSGYMGDTGDIIEVNESWTGNSHSGTSSIKVIYDARGQGPYQCGQGVTPAPSCKWAGVYWLNPPDNFGKVCNVGYNLTGFNKLVLWARSDEPVTVKFLVGGAGWGRPEQPPCPDSLREPKNSGWQTLGPTEWTRIEIDLKGADLNYIVGGFAWVANWGNNEVNIDKPKRLVFYLDDIRYER